MSIISSVFQYSNSISAATARLTGGSIYSKINTLVDNKLDTIELLFFASIDECDATVPFTKVLTEA